MDRTLADRMDDLDLGATIKGFSPGQKVFSRYQLKKILGRGGMGVVWLAHDEELERDIALKFLPEIVALDPEAVSDLKRETRRNLELTHPHIVRIYDFVTDTRTAAISMEFVDGSTLTALKVERPSRVFTLAELRPWLTQLVEALHYAHTKPKIVHRDLKPANLMITRSGDLKVTDFGIARGISDSVSRVSVHAGSSGTPVYMSPQQMMGDKPAVADDLYAFGATLYELLTGKPPFYSGNVILQVQSKVAPTLAERRAELGVTGEVIPPEWEQAIAACLAKEPAARPPSIRAVGARLGLVEGGAVELASESKPEPPPVAPVAPAAAAQPAAKAAPWALIGSLAGVALLLLAGAGWWFGVHQPEQRRQAEVQRLAEEARRAEEQAKIEDDRVETLRNNLRQLSAAADQHFLEHGVNEVPVTKLIGVDGYIRRMNPVDGEDYLGLGVIRLGQPFTVTTKGGLRATALEGGGVRIERIYQPTGGTLAAGATPASARPVPGRAWENSLGMKFVPVAGTAVLFSVFETRRQDFEAYARSVGLTWAHPGFAQGPTHPAVNVTWNEARAFCAWLTDQERAAGRIGPNQRYRLPTDAEWSLAVGLPAESGATPAEKDGQIADVYPWSPVPGNGVWPPNRRVGNFPDAAYSRDVDAYATVVEDGYDDGFAHTSPVGSFPATNGLYDLSGNVWEWCEDLYQPGELGRVLRGGSFAYMGFYLRYYLQSSYRNALEPATVSSDVGFRPVLETGP